MDKKVAIVLAAGQGKRMQSNVAKQFMELGGRALVCYALETFEKSDIIDEIILVTNEDAVSYCQKEIVEKNKFNKVTAVVSGGKERYDSVYEGLKAAKECDYIYIHDGARPFITEKMLCDLDETVREYGACVAAMPVKDTIKIVENGFAVSTPNRATLWQIQTPQVFHYPEILEAYENMLRSEHADVTDDAMVMEKYGSRKIKMCLSDYRNMKITTPEDLLIAEAFLAKEKS